MLDLDWITVIIDTDLPAGARSGLDDGTDSYRNGVHVKWEGRLGPDVNVYARPGKTVVAGSPHKLLRGESVGQFGLAETRAYAEELSGRLHVPLDVVLGSHVSRVDLGANLLLDHDVAEYIRLTSPPPKMWEVGSGPGSTVFKNTRVDILFYDKVAKVKRRRGHLVPAAWDGENVLRVEVRFRRASKEFKRALTLGDLCDDAFWREATARWLARALSVPLDPLACAVPFGPTKTILAGRYRDLGVQATGGRPAALLRIDRSLTAGLLTHAQAKSLRRMVRVDVLIEGDEAELIGPSAVPLVVELNRAIRSAACGHG